MTIATGLLHDVAEGDEIGGHVLIRELTGELAGEPDTHDRAIAESGRRFVAEPPARLGVDGLVVVKLSPGDNDRAFDRFVRELRLFAQLDSPYVVQLYEAGQDPGWFWVSMEHCPRGSLANTAQPVERAGRARAVADAARAVHALHEAGVAHRDIRPGTILVDEHDGRLGGKLADLALARHVEAEASVMASMSHVDYVDPAIIRGEPAGRASDVYSLGAVLHWVLAGASLFPHTAGLDPMSAVRAVLRDGPLIDKSLDPDEADLITSMITADTSERVIDAATAASRIDELIGGWS